MRLSKFILDHATTRRVALKGLVGASVAVGGVRAGLAGAGLARAQDAELKPATLRKPLTLFVGGLDSRQVGEPENSDVLMVVRVDVVNRTVRVVSIPRDFWVTIPGFGEDKITRAYDFGSKTQNGMFKPGAELIKATFAENFGLAIDGVVLTTFTGFETIVDALGGVVVDNPYDVADAEYPTLDYGYSSIYYPAGVQTLTGVQALEFSRTRHQDGDGGRIMRQQIVLRALLERARDPEVAPLLPEIVKERRKTVKTDLGPSKHLALALAAPDFTNETIAFTTILDYVYEATAANGAYIYAGDIAQIAGFLTGVLSGEIDDPSYYELAANAPAGIQPEIPGDYVPVGSTDDAAADAADASVDDGTEDDQEESGIEPIDE